MNISFYKDDKQDMIAIVSGEIDESNASYVRQKLDSVIDALEINNFVLDFSKLDFMDSTGIGVLLGRYKKSKLRNIKMYIKNPSNHVDIILRTCGIYTIMQKIS